MGRAPFRAVGDHSGEECPYSLSQPHRAPTSEPLRTPVTPDSWLRLSLARPADSDARDRQVLVQSIFARIWVKPVVQTAQL
jgi:hypothetical protein